MVNQNETEPVVEKSDADKAQKFQNEEPVAAWTADDFMFHDREANWYVKILVAAGLIGIFLFFLKIWTGMILLGVFTIFIFFGSRQKPKNVACAVYEKGIVVDNKVHLFEDFKVFWVTYSGVPKIKLQHKGFLVAPVEMPFESLENLEVIRKLLSEKMPEENRGEEISDTINLFIKF
jgi:hypothetical protein